MPVKMSSTKHYQAEQRLRAEIRTMRPGEVVPPVDELCAKTGFSHGTLVRALGRLAEEGFIARPAGTKRLIVREQGDKPLARIMLVRPDYPSAGYEGIARQLYKHGKAKNWLFPHQFFHDIDKLDLESAFRESDAVVLLPTAEALPPSLLQALHAPAKPVVLLMQHTDDPAILSVSVDDYEVGRIAAERLLRLGHRRLVALQDQPMDMTISERLRGWNDALAAQGLEHNGCQTLSPKLVPHDDAREVTYRFFSAWWKKNGARPDRINAIFTTSATGAQAALRTFHEQNVRVPEEVSLCAFSGEANDCEFTVPQLTAVGFDMEAYGRETVRLLDACLNREEPAECVIRIKPHWKERESTLPSPNLATRNTATSVEGTR